MEYSRDIPLYMQIADDIQFQIMNHSLPPEDKLPTEKYYMELYHVSRITIRKAMDELEARSMIVKIKNKGCFIKKASSHQPPVLKGSIYTTLQNAGISVTSKIIRMEIITATPEFTEKLHCNEGESLLMIERLRLGNQKPFAIQKIWLMEKMFPNFNPWKLSDDSLRRIMIEDYNCILSFSQEQIEARMPSEEIAGYLQISTSTPLIFITSQVYCSDSVIAEYSETYYDTDEYAYSISQRS